jgi:hypothetical protein
MSVNTLAQAFGYVVQVSIKVIQSKILVCLSCSTELDDFANLAENEKRN